ncbi:hypothetical protein TorRG33x02_245080 [Trema orientale]|uniref:Uncharacterized protein n=1 Tax=Trema orientale TaxID=63057 RepID=A0A2P5DQ29_TREOI|nr:hypothetical protein TorRG33x02_245080 [Trema orientale]
MTQSTALDLRSRMYPELMDNIQKDRVEGRVRKRELQRFVELVVHVIYNHWQRDNVNE